MDNQIKETLKKIAARLKEDNGQTHFPGWNYDDNPESEEAGRTISLVCARISRETYFSGEDVSHKDLAVLVDYIAEMLEI